MAIGSQPGARIVVLPIEVALPRPPEAERKKEDAAQTAQVLYGNVEREVQLNVNFFVLVVLSTVVAAIGLIEDNVAVVIGAMVIAPLLGPNLALALGTALGDTALIRKSLSSGILGIGLAIALSTLIGFVWPFQLVSRELLARTDVGLDSIALALASGAAAVLSITTGLSSVLVGVMVAVALLPPAAALGLHPRPRPVRPRGRSRPPARGKRGMRQPCEQGRVPSRRGSTTADLVAKGKGEARDDRLPDDLAARVTLALLLLLDLNLRQSMLRA